jgi:broad specificity phosphatase PhoE
MDLHDGWKRFFLVRHAQSENTYRWRWNQDHPNETPKDMLPSDKDDLSEDGMKQVATMLTAISHLQVDHVLFAPSVRCRSTAGYITTVKGVITKENFKGTIQTDPRLLEWKALDYTEEKDAPIEDQVNQWIEAVFQEREGNTLVVTHAAIMAKALSRILGLNQNVRFGPAVGSLTTLDWHPKTNRFVIHELGARICGTKMYWHNEDTFKKL